MSEKTPNAMPHAGSDLYEIYCMTHDNILNSATIPMKMRAQRAPRNRKMLATTPNK